MASLARRQIDTKFQNTSLLNKAASQSTSLYQKCSLLREKLRRIRGFTERFPDLAESLTQDPVTHLWDLFSTGTPLCYIYDQLPAKEGFKKLDYYTLSENKRSYETEINWDRAKKHGIALFAMHLRAEKITEKIPGCEMFTVTDLWERRSTDGLVKVCCRASLQDAIVLCPWLRLLIGHQHRHLYCKLPSTGSLRELCRFSRPFYWREFQRRPSRKYHSRNVRNRAEIRARPGDYAGNHSLVLFKYIFTAT